MSVWTQTAKKYVDGVELKGKVDDLAKEDAARTEYSGFPGRKDSSSTLIYCIKASAAILISVAWVSGTVG